MEHLVFLMMLVALRLHLVIRDYLIGCLHDEANMKQMY